MALTEDQQRAVATVGRPMFIQAGAGTGKTFTLTKRLAHALNPEVATLKSIDEVLTITFTNKAAGELLDRVRKELREHGLNEDALKIDGAWISTIHGMCSRILTEHAAEAGIDPGAPKLMNEQIDELYAEAFEQIYTEFTERTLELSPEAYELFAAFEYSKLENLASALAKKLQTTPGGIESFTKAPVSTRPPHVILCECLEVAKQTEEALLATEAVTGKSYKQKAEFYEHLAYLQEIASDPNIYELTYAQALEKLVQTKFSSASTAKELKVPLMEERELLACKALELSVMASRIELELLLSLAELLLERYEVLKAQVGAMDTDDLLARTFKLLQQNPELAKEYEHQFKMIMVDEFQDTDALQLGIIRAMAGEQLSSLTTVGDEQQSIYGFRGADLELYHFTRELMGSCQPAVQEIGLANNYRSNAAVLECVEEIFKQPDAFGQRFFKVQPGTPAQSEQPAWLKTKRPLVNILFAGGKQFEEGGRKRYVTAETMRAASAEQLAEHFQQLHEEEGAAYGSMALLLRSVTEGNVRPYMDAFKRAGVPCILSGGKGFYAQPEVHAFIAALRVLENRDDDEAMYQLLASPLFALDDDDLLALATVRRHELERAPHDSREYLSLYDALEHQAALLLQAPGCVEPICRAHEVISSALSQVNRVSAAQILHQIAQQSGWSATCAAQGIAGMAQLANLDTFADHVADFEQDNGRNIAAAAGHFRDMLALFESNLGAKEDVGAMVSADCQAVRIMTIHASKGLEFPIVAVAAGDEAPSESPYLENGEPCFLTENGVAHAVHHRKTVDVPSTFAKEIQKAFAAYADEYESFKQANSTLGFTAYGVRLAAQREAEEAQRIFYVALTRARDMLYIIGNNKMHASKPEVEFKGSMALVAGAFFDDELPVGNTCVRMPSGAPVLLHYKTVKHEAAEQLAPEAESIHLFPPVVEPAALSHALVEKESALQSFSALHRNKVLTAGSASELLKKSARSQELATAFGTAFHALAQILVENPQVNFDERAAALARRHGLPAGEEHNLKLALAAWQASQRFAQVQAYQCRRAEYPFVVEVPKAGILLEGFIDLLCLPSKFSVQAIIEYYKTGSCGSVGSHHEDHREQGAGYAFAILSLGLAAEVEVAFVRVEEACAEDVVRYTAAELPELEMKIAELAGATC